MERRTGGRRWCSGECAVIQERLRSLEEEVTEVRTRVNGLLFLLAGAVATQIALKLVG